MNLRHLEYFVKVAEVGSITQAAAALRLTQPALSRQIRSFEGDLGWKLFERGARTIELTHAGEVVLREGLKIISAVQLGTLQMKREVEGGVIRIGYSPTLAGELLQQAITRFSQCHPRVSIQLFDSSTDEMTNGVLAGKLDFVVAARRDDERFEWTNLNTRQLVLAFSDKHRLAEEGGAIEVLSLEGMPLLLFSRYDYPEYWKVVKAYFREQGVGVKVAGEFDGIESMTVALQAGLGVALVSSSTTFSQGVETRPLTPAIEDIQVAVGWDASRGRENAVVEFIGELVLAANPR